MSKIGIADIKLPKSSIELVNQVLKTGRVSYGPFTQKFESKMARLHNRQFAIFCNSGSSALQVAIHALKIAYNWQEQDEVLVPAVTFIASANAIIHNNLKPVFVDIEADYFEIDPKQIEKHLSKKTKAIMPVHLFGQACEMKPILRLAKKYKLKVIEDSCEAMLVKYKGEIVGSWGDVACLSTYSTHLLPTGVGGFVMTNNQKLATKIRSLINHGRDPAYLSIDDDNLSDPQQLAYTVDRRFSFTDIGYSYKVTELEAALGLGQLDSLTQIIQKRNQNAQYLNQGLASLQDFLQLPQIRAETEHGFMLFPILIIDNDIKRDQLIQYLEQSGIETRYLMPLLSQPIYKQKFGDILKNYPVAENVDNNGFLIGCHDKLTKNELDHIIQVFHQYFKYFILPKSDLVEIIKQQNETIINLKKDYTKPIKTSRKKNGLSKISRATASTLSKIRK